MSLVIMFAGCAQLLGIDGDPTLVTPRQRSDPEAFIIHTTREDANAAALVSAMAKARLPVNMLMAGANRVMNPLCQTGPGSALYPLASASGASYGFCWAGMGMGAEDSIDPDNPIWVPQGITTSRDADGPRPYEGREAVVIAWHMSSDASARISIAPARGFGDSSGEKNYRHVLLVAPTPGADFTEVPCHAGGAAWYGHLLYVACG